MKDIHHSHPLLAVAVCGCSLVVVDVHQLIVDRTDEPRLKERDILGSCTRHMTGSVGGLEDMIKWRLLEGASSELARLDVVSVRVDIGMGHGVLE
jgi:hypothetical protein